MALRCFVFSSAEGTSDVIRQVLTGLGVEGESCSQATTAVEQLTRELFQLVVIDWDQSEAGMLIAAARERKAAERPLVLAMVSDDASIAKALQAGANSILRKPLLVNQVSDTLTTARDLLRSRRESAASAAAAGAGVSASFSVSAGAAQQASSRAGELLPSRLLNPGRPIESDTEVAHWAEPSAAEPTTPLEDLEPLAAAVEEPPPPPAPAPHEPKGLEWYLKVRGVKREPASVLATSAPPSSEHKPELLGYDQAHSSSGQAGPEQPGQMPSTVREKKEEALFSYYLTGESQESAEPSESRFRIGTRAIMAALFLAACGTVAAPQAPWHGKLVGLTAQVRRALQGWLNPQPITAVTQAPTSHEDFGRAGDEYKLPVAENIPDATTDPSQITVLPVVDPTAKKAAADANSRQAAATSESPAVGQGDGNQANPVPTPAVQSAGGAPDRIQTVGSPPPASVPADAPLRTETAPVNSSPAVGTVPQRKPSPVTFRPRPTPPTTKVPSSLKSQMAAMVPDAGGNKPVEAALPSIEPVEVPELTERALLTDQPPLVYPRNAAGKQGTVTLEVRIGRDGTVEDSKFLEGSLAFARAAIDGVRQWKFKPYLVNGRAVSVETALTLKFAPAQ